VPQVTWRPDGKGGFTVALNANNTPANAGCAPGMPSSPTTHMVLRGGVSGTTNQAFFPVGKAKVITAVGAPPTAGAKHPSVYTFEDTPWPGFRDAEHPYGFAAFTVDPGTGPGATTRIYATCYNVTIPTGAITPMETFTLQRTRSDGHR
jgi:hypothetical protein